MSDLETLGSKDHRLWYHSNLKDWHRNQSYIPYNPI